MIYCQAQDYDIKDYGKNKIVYLKSYEGNWIVLLLSSFLELFYPVANNFYIPISVIIPNTDKELQVDKNLKVYGCDEYEYVIIRTQYNIWKKTYAVTKNIIWCLAGIINIAFVYLWMNKNWNLFVGVCELVVLIISFGAIYKTEKENCKRKKYRVVDFNL